jgi:hypothetical protein
MIWIACILRSRCLIAWFIEYLLDRDYLNLTIGMINFGSAADKCVSYVISLMSRYTGPSIKPARAESEGSLTPVNTIPDPLPKPKKPKKVGLRYKFRKRPSTPKCYGNYNFPPEAYESFYADWDLIPPSREKRFPNWDVHQSISKTLGSCSRQTLGQLSRHEVFDNMPTIPSPHDIAILNILQDKLADWEKAEEDLFLRRKGWYCKNKHIEDRAYISWAMTQSRDFGSAVWRWLRLDEWDAVQTPRMKGLYGTAVM